MNREEIINKIKIKIIENLDNTERGMWFGNVYDFVNEVALEFESATGYNEDEQLFEPLIETLDALFKLEEDGVLQVETKIDFDDNHDFDVDPMEDAMIFLFEENDEIEGMDFFNRARFTFGYNYLHGISMEDFMEDSIDIIC